MACKEGQVWPRKLGLVVRPRAAVLCLLHFSSTYVGSLFIMCTAVQQCTQSSSAQCESDIDSTYLRVRIISSGTAIVKVKRGFRGAMLVLCLLKEIRQAQNCTWNENSFRAHR